MSELAPEASVDLIRDAGAWVEHAESLLLASSAVGERIESIVIGSGRRRRVEMLGLTRGYMTLLGASFECALKAVAVSRGMMKSSHGQIRFEPSFRGAESHDLPAMAKSLKLGLVGAEQDLLRRSSEYLAWAGRYPVAKKQSRTIAAYAEGKLCWLSMDRRRSRSLLDRIQNAVPGKEDSFI